MEKIAFCVITFEQIKIQTHSAPQNDCLNLSFVKGSYVDGKKWLELVVKWSFMSRKFCTTVSTLAELCKISKKSSNMNEDFFT